MMILNTLMNWANTTVATNEDGQDLVEYALVLVFVAIAAIVALMALGPTIADIYTQITTTLSA